MPFFVGQRKSPDLKPDYLQRHKVFELPHTLYHILTVSCILRVFMISKVTRSSFRQVTGISMSVEDQICCTLVYKGYSQNDTKIITYGRSKQLNVVHIIKEICFDEILRRSILYFFL